MAQQDLQQILDRLSISQLVSSYGVHLQSKGGKLWALCPFHQEKTPSFTVTEDKNSFYCFGCHRGGGAIQFIMDIENVSFKEALAIGAQKAGLSLEEKNFQSPAEKAAKAEQKGLFKILSWALSFYESKLWAEGEGNAGRALLESRKITQETARLFHLGLALEEGSFSSQLEKAGFSKDAGMKSGLLRESGSPLFRNRLLFPIYDTSGRVVAFSGRDLSHSERAPKYVNSPTTSIYKKKELLFGLHQSRARFAKSHELTLVEGNFDVLSLYQVSPLLAPVAPLGTALTSQQVSYIVSRSPSSQESTITLCFDGDRAGQEATGRALSVTAEFPLRSIICTLEAGSDPADYIERGDDAALLKALGEKTSPAEFVFRRSASPEEAIRSMGQIARLYPSGVSRATAAQEMGRLTGIDSAVIGEEWRRLPSPSSSHFFSSLPDKSASQALENPEEFFFLGALLVNWDEFLYLRKGLSEDISFNNSLAQSLFEAAEAGLVDSSVASRWLADSGVTKASLEWLESYFSVSSPDGISLEQYHWEKGKAQDELCRALAFLRLRRTDKRLDELYAELSSGSADEEVKKSYVELLSQREELRKQLLSGDVPRLR